MELEIELVFINKTQDDECKLEVNVKELVARLSAIVEEQPEIITLSIMSILDEIEDKKLEIA